VFSINFFACSYIYDLGLYAIHMITHLVALDE
jgi:hypothetical protein